MSRIWGELVEIFIVEIFAPRKGNTWCGVGDKFKIKDRKVTNIVLLA